MQIRRLGTITGSVLLFGGPYSNLPALEAMHAVAHQYDHALCTGDVVAYGAQPRECVAIIRDWGLNTVAGNCERQLAEGQSNCGCGFDPGSQCDVASNAWFSYASDQIEPRDRAWMAQLPDIITFTHAGRHVAALHGGVRTNNQFIWPTQANDLRAAIAELRAMVGPVDMVIAGHCGVGFIKREGDAVWLNAGVIGMPQNDGDVRTVYATLTDDGVPNLHRLSYDHIKAARSMVHAGLTQGYQTGLTTGWWPSEDVLPLVLRQASSPRERVMIEYQSL